MSIALILLLIAVAVGTVGVGVGVVVVKAASNRQLTAAPAPKQIEAGGLADGDVLDSNVKDLGKGGLLEITGFGDSYEDVQLEVEAYTRYSRARDEWHELQSTYQTRQVAIVWDEERGVLRVWAVKHLRAKALADFGLDAASLDGLAKGASIEGGGESWTLDDMGKSYSHSNGTGFGKEHHSWELLSGDQRKILRIERWNDDPHTVSLGEAIEPDSITIYRLKGKT